MPALPPVIACTLHVCAGPDADVVDGAGGGVEEGAGGVVLAQLNDVVGGRVVQAHGSPVGRTAYVDGELPHSHQPGPSAMAAQVFCGSAAW